MAIYTVPGSFATIQAALNAAVAGDIIQLHAGTLYTETVTCPNKGSLASYITITTDASAANLPAAGVRTSPSYAAFLPQWQSAGGGGPAVAFAQGADHYQFTHIYFLPSWGAGNGGSSTGYGYNDIIRIGEGTESLASQTPNHVVVDQCVLRGHPVAGQKRAISLQGRNISVTNCWVDQINAVGQDSQCLGGYNGQGPFTVTNNLLRGGTEPILIGGADPACRTLMTASAATTTSASVTCSEGGHTLSELSVGQQISILTGAGVQHSILRSITGGGASGSITFDAIANTPSVPGDLRAGAICQGLTFQRNYVSRDPTTMAGVLQPVTGVSASAQPGVGSLAPGTYYYVIQAFSPDGYLGTWVNGAGSSQVSAFLGSPGRINLSWSPVAGTNIVYRVWRGTVSGNTPAWAETSSTSFADDGSHTYTTETAPYAPTTWQTKNLFEIKACLNAQIDSNIFEYQWRGSDIGFAVWLKSANQDGEAWWVGSKNITFEKNIIRHCFGFCEISGSETNGTVLPPVMENVTVRNNLVYDCTPSPWGEGSFQYAFGQINGPYGYVVDHNTVVASVSGLIATDSSALQYLTTGFVFTNNMVPGGDFGIHDPAGNGSTALNLTTSGGYSFLSNAVSNTGSAGYPASNFYPTQPDWESQFVSYALTGGGADFHIKPTSAYHNAGLDGKDLGADIDLVLTATNGVDAGAGVSVTMNWMPSLPVSIPRDLKLSGVFGPFYAANSHPQEQVIARIWSDGFPRYPSTIDRKKWTVPSSLVAPIQPLIPGGGSPVPLRSWAPTYPDRIERKTQPAALQTAVFKTPTPLPGDIGWLPQVRYPERVRGLAVHPALLPFVVWPLRAGILPPTLSWAPAYPNQIWPKAHLRTTLQEHYVFYPWPIPGPLPPGQGWQETVYPNQIWPKVSLRTSLQETFVVNLVPIPNPPPPTELTWQPQYPVQISTKVRTPWLVSQVGNAVFEPPRVALQGSWWPIWPQPTPPRWSPAGLPEPAVLNLSTQPAIGAIQTWQGEGPDLPVRSPSALSSLLAGPVFMPVLVPPPSPGPTPPVPVCIVLGAEVAGPSVLTNELGGRPTLSSEISGDETAAQEIPC